jgi:hypothetical protein
MAMCASCPPGSPLELVQPDIMRFKAFEPVLLLGRNRLKNLDIRIRVRGGGNVSQIYGEQAYSLCSCWLLHAVLAVSCCACVHEMGA